MPSGRKRRIKNKEASALNLTDLESRQLIAKNLPYKASEEQLKKYLSEYGEICQVKLLQKSSGDPIGRAVIQFTEDKNAAEAFKNCNGKDFMGRKIVLGWAAPSSETENVLSNEVKEEPVEETALKEDVIDSEDEERSLHESEFEEQPRKKIPRLEKQNIPKNKKGRLIVRNLPFKITENKLREHFQQYGDIKEVSLLRKPDGKLVGCGFVQFANKNCAAKAILHSSGKPLQGRIIIVDWAVSKSLFKANNKSIASEEVVIKEEKVDEEEESKPEIVDNNDSISRVKEEPLSDDSAEDRHEEDTDDESDDSYGGIKEESEDEFNDEVKKSKPKVVSNDVSEERTVFVKNVPFSATSNDLKACMNQFGAVMYAVICIDPVTEHSRGTAFVKFQTKESAEKCLSAGTELVLKDEILDVFKALSKDELNKKMASKHEEQKKKDSRNLYLVKEGVIVAGSNSAVGVSMPDMSKRLQLEQWKSQMLRNLNMFVSRTRLIVHNLPPSWTNEKLRQLFLRYAGPNAVIKEARVMRDMKILDAEGIGRSKEFGFVTFVSHEHALQALRNINNNPNIFSASKRPIVAFSIENRAILNIKQKRIEKSRSKNPTYSGNVDKHKNGRKRPEYQEKKESWKNVKTKGNAAEETESFVGVTSKPGKIKMRNRFNLKTQAKVHKETISQTKKKEKKQHKKERTRLKKEKKKRSQPNLAPKKNRSGGGGNFDKLVNKYKANLISATKKWYEP